MALEQSANCYSKAKMGGTIGVARKEVAHMQWLLTVHERGVITGKSSSSSFITLPCPMDIMQRCTGRCE